MNRTIPVGSTPRITIDVVGGDLSIVGWEGQDLLIKGDEDEIRVHQDGEAVTVSSDDDVSLRVPQGASVAIGTVNGDMALRGITGVVEMLTINGDLSMRDVNAVTIETVNGDFSLRGAKGSLRVQSLTSDASIRDVEGDVNLASVADDLALRDVRGNLQANVGADVVLYLNPKAGQSYNVTAGDDILLVLPPQADATLTLSGDEIELDWPGLENDEDATSRVITLGTGAAHITLKAGGDMRVSSESGAGERAEEFGNFAGMMFDWDLSDFGKELSERISRRVADATRRAEQKAARAGRKANQAARHAQSWSVNWPSSVVPPAPPSEPVSEEERMAILKMLAEKKITSEQADQLLAALEGGE